MLQRNLVSNYKRCISNKNGVGQGMPEEYSWTRIALISDAAFATTLMDDSRWTRICEYVLRVLCVPRSISLILALIRAKGTNPGARKREEKIHARGGSECIGIFCRTRYSMLNHRGIWSSLPLDIYFYVVSWVFVFIALWQALKPN